MGNQCNNVVEHVFDPMWEAPPAAREDLRHIDFGYRIAAAHYADQPYLTQTADGGLLCVVTTGTGSEGSRGQHVLSMKSFDGGRTWQDVQPVESPQAPESSWGVPVTAPSGRVFVFYIFNADDVRDLPADNPPYRTGLTQRMDSHGYYVFRWSDDHGKTWSKERGVIPVREFAIDRANATGGKVRFFWNVGKAFIDEGALFLPIHKVGGFGEGWFTSSEGGLLRSNDLLTVADPLLARWVTLPEGEHGIRLRQVDSPVNEEHSFATLSDGSFFTVFRTVEGHPGCAYSRDKGQTWTAGDFMRYADGRPMKHPRAANFVWKMKDGGYLYVFHNHGGRFLREHPQRRVEGYMERNPMWFCRGWEADSAEGRIIQWSQPEIGLYSDDPMVRISYPDFIEQEGRMLFTETEKSTARVHYLAPEVVDALSGDEHRRTARLGVLKPLLEWTDGEGEFARMPELPAFIQRDAASPYGSMRTREGFSIHLEVRIGGDGASTLCRCEGEDGSRFELQWSPRRTLRLLLNDGQTEAGWESDPVPATESAVSFVVNVDGGCNIISIYRDALLDDGGELRRFGWGRISPFFRNRYEGKSLRIFKDGCCRLVRLKLFSRIVTSAEVAFLYGKRTTRKAGAKPLFTV